MNKILERSESWVVLEPLKQYLESEGGVSEIRYEWIGNRGSHGDAVLLVEEDVYERARAILDEIDKTDMGDGQPLRDASGRTFAERKALYDKLGKYLVRGVLVFIIAMLIYGLIKYPPF